MANLKTVYTCSKCDAQYPKWSGRCLECGSWGTMGEEIKDVVKEEKKSLLKSIGSAHLIDLREINTLNDQRWPSNISEVDRVLGGGIVPGSLILLSGEPGIGKSTLVAQIANALSKNHAVVYASGEESASQVKGRLERLNCSLENLQFIGETNIEKIISSVLMAKPDLLIVDSIQTVYSSLIPSESGSINQIRGGAVKFMEMAKANDISVILIGHITKDGQVAGPKALEHIVDTVLYLEAENNNNYCLLRASKNRFGSVNELGILEMTGTGFIQVENPSLVFIDASHANIAGSVIGCVVEGSRPFLVDLQALASKTIFGYPQRKSSGFDLNRLQVLAAVLSKRTKLNLTSQDIILNVVGGLRLNDPALDLAVCTAIMSSFFNKNFDRHTIVLGEVGLGGEIRAVSRLEQRLAEAQKLGFTQAVIPDVEVKFKGLKLVKLKDLGALLEMIK